MISKSFKVLEVIDGEQYVFSSFALKTCIRKYKSDKKTYGEIITSEMIMEALADSIHVSVDAIKNWMYEKNGPGDLETVKSVAGFLNVDYVELLKKQEKNIMSENNVIIQGTNINMEKTKDVIRVIYQKMSGFMDAAVHELCFDSDENIYWKYEEVYRDMIGTLHKSMLDIPIGIYDQLRKIAECDLFLYMYGIPEGPADVWDLSEFYDFCSTENLNGYVAKLYYMEKKADEFYTTMREILKDYLLA